MYLDASRSEVYQSGLLVSELVSSKLTPNVPLKFDFVKSENYSWLTEAIGSPLKNNKQIREKTLEKMAVLGDSTAKVPATNIAAKSPTIPYFAAKRVNDSTPRFLNQALTSLKSDVPDQVQSALLALESLIEKSSSLEIGIF